jgi:DNA-binding transcriptional LysR family regulator
MIAGARIVLDARLDAARDGLAGLAEASWMMSLPRRRAAYHGHPAGSGRRGSSDDRGARLVAVTFGSVTAPAADQIILPFRWEPAEPGGGLTVQLSGSITLARAVACGHSALTLAGICQIPSGALAPDDFEEIRLELMEASREFITTVARDVNRAAGSASEPGPGGPAWAW